ncbi:MAG: type III pantothenate kinase [Treponema sp.]|uniref:type III pantothenate kinase n=1 Tax=Treponema sp. TaxID=166 RepID=UPI00298ECCA6|nr:type III pantothenate kinase [Treponema sp.]MCQ2600830.1 type III pantothenate kinase [Treponema sp.]
MILTVDVGNTQITGGLFDEDGKLVLQFRRTTHMGTSSDELGLFFRSVIRENGFHWQKIQRIGVCSVVPSINYSLQSAFTKYFNCRALFIQAGIKTGLKLRYANPKEIGADRIAAAIGAVSLHPDTDLIVIDMGTATTIDVVTKDKEYLGGAIIPGLRISVEALANGTAKLPMVEIAKPEHSLGNNTIEAIQAGIYYSHLGGLKELCSQYASSIFSGKKPLVLGTGGFSRIFEETKLFDEISPELVLLGIKKALELNKE